MKRLLFLAMLAGAATLPINAQAAKSFCGTLGKSAALIEQGRQYGLARWRYERIAEKYEGVYRRLFNSVIEQAYRVNVKSDDPDKQDAIDFFSRSVRNQCDYQVEKARQGY